MSNDDTIITGLFDMYEFDLVLDALDHFAKHLDETGLPYAAKDARKLLAEMRTAKHTDTITDNLTGGQNV